MAPAGLAAWWGHVTVAYPVAVESAGLLSVQLLCFWLPGLVDFLIHRRAAAAADAARLQRGKMPSLEEWRHCVRIVLRNTFASEVLHWTYLGMKGWKPTTRVAGPLPSLGLFAREVALLWVIREVVFYFLHRAMHAPSLYARIHKMHHHYQAPVMIAAQYSTLIDHVGSNLLPFMQPIMLVRPHVFSAWFVLVMGLLKTVANHSGYACLGPHHHDKHHEVFTCNYGAIWMDAIFGTIWVDPKAPKAKAKAKSEEEAKAEEPTLDAAPKAAAKAGAAPRARRAHLEVRAY